MYKWAAGRSDVRTKHLALYGYLLTCVRDYKKDRFTIKTEFAMLTAAMKFKKAYRETLADLEKWGFIEILEKGKNQFVLTSVKILDFDPDKGLNAEPVAIEAVATEIEEASPAAAEQAAKPKKEGKVLYGKYVRLKVKEYEGMVAQYGEPFTKRCIEKLDNYAPNRKNPYKDYMSAMNSWVIQAVQKDIDDEQREQEGHRGGKPRDGDRHGGVQRAIPPDKLGEGEYKSTIPALRTPRGG